MTENPAAAEAHPSFAAALQPHDQAFSREEWLRRAGDQYPTVRLVLEFLRLDDAGLKAKVAEMPGEFTELLESVNGVADSFRTSLEVMEAFQARLVIVFSAFLGEPLPSAPRPKRRRSSARRARQGPRTA